MIKKGLFYFIVLIFFASCEWPSSRISNSVVLKVEEEKLTLKEFSDRLGRKLKTFDALGAKDPNNVKRAKEEVLNTFTFRVLVGNYAKKEGISISDAEVEKEINQFRSSYPDDLSFRRALTEENLSIADWKEDLSHSLLEKKVFLQITQKVLQPTEEEIKRYYEENKLSRFKRAERIFLRQIVVDELSKAEALKEQLKKEPFDNIAKKYSVAPEGKQGGVVGWVEKGSIDIFDKAFSMPLNTVGPILESSYGFHIFKVDKKAVAGYASLEEVREIIKTSIMGQREQAEFAGWLDKQIRQSRVFKDVRLIEAVKVETRGEK